MGKHEAISRPYTVPNLASRWGCSEGLIRKMIDRGELRSFRLGILIRVPADEVERVECQSQSHTASNDSGEVLPSSGGPMESADAARSTPTIGRARRRRLAPSGGTAATSRGQ